MIVTITTALLQPGIVQWFCMQLQIRLPFRLMRERFESRGWGKEAGPLESLVRL